MLATRTSFLVVALAVNLVLASTLHVREARACSCAGGFSVQEELRDSDAVFWGEAVSVEEQGSTSSAPPFLGPVTFEVRESWKGASQEQVIVHGQWARGELRPRFRRGQDLPGLRVPCR